MCLFASWWMSLSQSHIHLYIGHNCWRYSLFPHEVGLRLIFTQDLHFAFADSVPFPGQPGNVIWRFETGGLKSFPFGRFFRVPSREPKRRTSWIGSILPYCVGRARGTYPSPPKRTKVYTFYWPLPYFNAFSAGGGFRTKWYLWLQ